MFSSSDTVTLTWSPDSDNIITSSLVYFNELGMHVWYKLDT